VDSLKTGALTILVVEENPLEVETLESLVATHLAGTRLLCTGDGREALRLAVSEDPDLILVGDPSAGTDAYALCEALKEDGRLGAVPVLLLLGPAPDRGSRLRALDSGAEGFLARPLDDVELVAQVRAMAKVKKAQRASTPLEQDAPGIGRGAAAQRGTTPGGKARALPSGAAGLEDALREIQRRLSALMSDLPGMAYRCRNDSHWTMEFVSEGCLSLTGYPAEDLLEQPRSFYGEMIHPDDRPAVWEAVQSAVRNGRPFQLMYRIVTAAGREKWVWEQGRGIMGAEGRPDTLEGFITDITEARKGEEDLRRNEARLRSLVEIHQYRARNTKDFLDHALRQAIGITGSTIGFLSFYDEDRKQLVLNSWSKETLDACSIPAPETCYALDDTGIWGEAVRRRGPLILNDYQAPHPLKKGIPEGHAVLNRFLTLPVLWEGRIEALVGVGNKASDYDQADVLQLTLLMDAVWKSVELMKGEEALRESEERYRLLTEGTRDIILLHDQEGRIEYLNQAGLDFLGLEAKAALGSSILDLVSPEHVGDLFRNGGGLTSGDSPGGGYETVFENRTGEQLPVEVRTTPIVREGDSRYTLVVARDITERRRAEEDRERLQAQLIQAQKMEAVGRLAGGVAHDFNNMLSVILGHTEFVLEHLPPGEPFHVDLQEIRKAAERSAELTRQLLAFARKQAIAPEVLDLNASVEGALHMLRRLIGENIELVWRPNPEIWPVRMDPVQVGQILANLCVNARDAIVGVGTITIETGTTVLDEAFCAEHPGSTPGEYTVMSVVDTGSGMNEKTLERLFEPFFTTKELGKGTGLGLAMTYGIVKQNSGFISAHSEKGRGATFRIFLPRHRATVRRLRREEAKASLEKGHETILLVEDEPAVMSLTRRVLERYGYRVLEASTPGEAMRLAAEHAEDIHLLLTDVVMPEMNGKELAASLTSLYPHLKRLFMSGYPASAIVHHGVLDRGVAFIQKPFTTQSLAAKVRGVLDRD
jgi:two-component system, cell cycle sensor histidine kinase and response regulator CckA